MKRILALFIFIVVILPSKIIAGGGSKDSALHTKIAQWMNNSGGLRFLENKGQMMDMQRKPVNNVLYKTGAGGMDIYITTSGLSYMFTKYNRYKKKGTAPFIDKRHQRDSVMETYCRADMQLVGASIKKENIIEEGESTDRSDYYYGEICPNGILGVHSYEKITIKNIYPGIDWVLQGGKQGLKYNFIVHPGVDPSLIKLKYKWTDAPQLQADGSIKINTPMGNITEGTPVSYCNGEQVHTAYSIADSEIHFNVSNYNSSQTLVIDPTLVWATYYGGFAPSDADILAMDADGSDVWLTGTADGGYFSSYNPGGGAYFQGTSSAVLTVIILEFNNAGVLQWATYYGGNYEDEGLSINSDTANVWITGWTSSSNFPVFNPGGGAYYQGTLNEAESAFILQFSTKGVRKWATYYGGTNAESGASIQSDGSSVWVTGAATSTDLPTQNPGGGAYFQGALTGMENAFILQFNRTGVRQWATYYGGAGNGTFGQAIQSDGKNVWVTGLTRDSSLPVLNPGGGAYFVPKNSNMYADVFLLKFNTQRVRKWATYYGGNDSASPYGDEGYFINSDGTNVWVTGQTSSSNFPTYNPGGGTYFQGTLASIYGNAFILKFDTAGVRKWATYYGGNSYGNGDVGDIIQSDKKHVWLGGVANVSHQFPLYNPGCGFYEDSTDVPVRLDPFLAEFSLSGVRQWATFYGADMIEDDCDFIWSDGTNIFVSGDGLAGSYPMLNPGGGAYFDSVASGFGELIWVGKFILDGGSVNVNPGVSICRGDSTILSASGAASYHWSPPTGLSDTNTANPIAKPMVTTTYTVTGSDTGGCGGTYEDSVTVVVDTLRVSLSNDTTICSGSSVTLRAQGGTSYKWSTGSTTGSVFIVNDSATQTYTLSISNGVCQKDTLIKINVVPLPKPLITGTLLKCAGAVDTLTVSSSVNPTTYKWGNGSTSTSIITGSITSDTTIYVTAYDSLGCPVKDSFKIGVKQSPVVTVNSLAFVCSGTPVLLEADAQGTGPFTYMWMPGGKTTDTITVNPNSATSYSVVVSNGCITTKTITVTPDNPILSACCNNTIFVGDDTVLVAKSTTAKSYQWSPQVNCLNPLCDSVQVSPIVTTTYTVTMTDSAGCQIERVVTIVVDMPCADFTVPNVFTPDYAGLMGLNNVFYINVNNSDTWSIIIYDRWGKEMFQSTNPSQYWDGNTGNGGKAPDGVYYYIINAACQGTSYKKDGFLQLIR